MAVSDFVLNGLTQMESLLGNPKFTWNGEQWACVPNTFNDSAKPDKTGYEENGDFRLTVRLNQFTPGIYPQLTDSITYLGQEFFIMQIKKTPHGIFWVYVCKIGTAS